MRQILLATIIFSVSGTILSSEGMAQGPDNQPAVLRTFMDPPAGGSDFANPTAGAFSPGMSSALPKLPDYKPQPDPNQDLFVTPAEGPWLICVNCYIGPESAKVAREIVMDLRERYKLPAYVFSKNDEERRKEFERVKKVVEQYHKSCLEQKLPIDTHFRVKMVRFENEYAVLVGNYKDADTARAALEKLRKLAPDPKLCYVKAAQTDSPDPFKPLKANDKKNVTFVNPFNSAFVVHNPATKLERPADWDKPDIAVLQRLNHGENYSLLNCKKNYTLVVRQFLLPAEIRSIKDGTIFGKINPFAHQSEVMDPQAHNAHNLADLMHKSANLDAFVLHTKYASMVTVGSFDRLDDPALRTMQETLKNQFHIPLQMPMAVPR